MIRKVPKFRDVALFTIVVGAAVCAYGVVTWILNVYYGGNFFFPSFKVVGGWIVVALGYVHLNLEYMREKKSE